MQAILEGFWALVGAGVGAIGGSYLKKKGENYATKEDVNLLVDQVRAVTTATKRIENSITHEYRRWEIKKEVLFDLLEKCGMWIDALNRYISATFASSLDPQAKPASFSDPIEMAVAYANVHRELQIAILKVKVTCKAELVEYLMMMGRMVSDSALYAGNGEVQKAQNLFQEVVGGLNKLIELVAEELYSMPKN